MGLGGEAKVGALTFFVPASGAGTQTKAVTSIGARLRPHILNAPAAMNAILARVNQPISKVMAFKKGDIVPIDAKALTRIQLEVREDIPIVKARLGQVNGFRAVRLTQNRNARDDDVFSGAGRSVSKTEGRAAILADVKAPTQDLTSAPELPVDVGPPGDLAELPDLPDLPDLDDLPDLPDFPPS